MQICLVTSIRRQRCGLTEYRAAGTDLLLCKYLCMPRDDVMAVPQLDYLYQLVSAAGEVEKKCYTVLAPGGTYAHIFNE